MAYFRQGYPSGLVGPVGEPAPVKLAVSEVTDANTGEVLTSLALAPDGFLETNVFFNQPYTASTPDFRCLSRNIKLDCDNLLNVLTITATEDFNTPTSVYFREQKILDVVPAEKPEPTEKNIVVSSTTIGASGHIDSNIKEVISDLSTLEGAVLVCSDYRSDPATLVRNQGALAFINFDFGDEYDRIRVIASNGMFENLTDEHKELLSLTTKDMVDYPFIVQ